MVLISALTDPERARVAIKAVSIDVDIVGVAGMDLVRRLRDFKYRIQGEDYSAPDLDTDRVSFHRVRSLLFK